MSVLNPESAAIALRFSGGIRKTMKRMLSNVARQNHHISTSLSATRIIPTNYSSSFHWTFTNYKLNSC
ncbi:unnamed protein product [Tenebrio molitor]|nr:unnamed protein product [Tenebrio molitor]